MDGFIDILKSIQSVVWGPITLILLVGTDEILQYVWVFCRL